jgi:hypothetical protein
MFHWFAAAAVLCAAPSSTDGLLKANHDAMQAAAEQSGTVVSRYRYAGQGLEGSISSVVDQATGMFHNASDIGPIKDQDGYDGQRAWMRDVAGNYLPQDSEGKLALAINDAYRNANLWWREDRGEARMESIGCGGVRITPRGGVAFEAWFDPQSHLLERIREVRTFGTLVETRFSDYAEQSAGLIVPARVERITADAPATLETMQLTALELDRARPASAYAMPQGPRNWSLPASGTVTVPFRLLNNHIVVDVRIDGKGPFPFIVDTGGHNIITPDTLKALRIWQAGETVSGGGGEGSATNGYADVAELAMGAAILRNQTVIALEFSPLEVEGLALGGMLGVEFLDHFVVRFDYGTQQMTVMEPGRFVPRAQAAAGEAVPFTFYEHMPQVAGTLDGRNARFNIDTGSRSDVTLTRPYVERENLRSAYPDGRVMTEGWGVGGATRPYVTRVGKLALGQVSVDKPITGLSESRRGAFSDGYYDGNVGSGLLKRFVVTFDYPRQVMYLEPVAKPDADTGQLDKTGMWLNLAKDGFEVKEVVPGGPAAMSGLQAGDLVLAVGDDRFGLVSLSDIRRALKVLPVGKVVVVESVRGGVRRSVEMTPRALISD